MSSSSIPTNLSISPNNVVDVLNHLPKSELKKLTPEKLQDIISKCGENIPPMSKEEYISFGKRLHHIPSQTSAQFMRWAISHIHPDDISVTLNSLKTGCLSRLIVADFELDSRVIVDSKNVRDYLKFQEALLEASVKHELNLFYLNESQFKKWSKAPNMQIKLNKVAPISPKLCRHILKRYGEENLNFFKDYVNTRRERLMRVAKNQVIVNRLQHEKTIVDDFLETIDKMPPDTQINDVIHSILGTIRKVRKEDQSYLKKQLAFDYEPLFSSETCRTIRKLEKDKHYSDHEKRGILVTIFQDMGNHLRQSIHYAQNRIELLNHLPSQDSEQTIIDRFKTCIADDELDMVQMGNEILAQTSSLELAIATREAFLSRVESLNNNTRELKDLKTELKSTHQKVSELKSTSLNLSKKMSEDKYVDDWKVFLRTHRFEAKLSEMSRQLIEYFHDKLEMLDPAIVNELNVKHRMELITLYNQSLTSKIPNTFRNIISLGSDRPVSERMEDEWGMHQKVSWQLHTVRNKIKSLEPHRTIASSTSSNPTFNEADEGIDIVTKISELGITSKILQNPPFLFPESSIGDWSKYAEFFMKKGVKFSDIQNITSQEEFISWYTKTYADN